LYFIEDCINELQNMKKKVKTGKTTTETFQSKIIKFLKFHNLFFTDLSSLPVLSVSVEQYVGPSHVVLTKSQSNPPQKRTKKTLKIKIISKKRLKLKKTKQITTKAVLSKVKKQKKQPASKESHKQPGIRDVKIVLHRLSAGEISAHEINPQESPKMSSETEVKNKEEHAKQEQGRTLLQRRSEDNVM
jgi:hypothetical protein